MKKKIYQPTLISNEPNLQPQQSARLTTYTSVTGSTRPRSTLHQEHVLPP